MSWLGIGIGLLLLTLAAGWLNSARRTANLIATLAEQRSINTSLNLRCRDLEQRHLRQLKTEADLRIELAQTRKAAAASAVIQLPRTRTAPRGESL